ncbi:MAG: ATP-binding protein [Pseudomonadota bacterium]
MNIYSYTTLLTFIAALSLSLFVFLNNRKENINKCWALLNFAIAIFTFGQFMRENSGTESSAFFWGVCVLYSGVVFIAPLFLNFILLFRQAVSAKKIILFLSYGFSFFSLLLIYFTDLVIKGVRSTTFFKYYTDPGLIYPLFLLIFSAIMFYAIYELIRYFKETSGIKRNQAKYLMIATAISFGGGATSFLTVFIPNAYPVGNIFIVFYAVAITYSIVKDRLMDINIVIKKGTTYVILTVLLYIPSLIVVNIAQMFFFGFINYLFSFIILLLVIVVAFIFPKLIISTERTIEQILFKGKYDYRKTLNELSKAMISILDREALLAKIIDTTTEAMGVEKASILLINEEKGDFYIQSQKGLEVSIKEVYSLGKDDPLIVLLSKRGKIVVKEELEGYLTVNIPANVTIVKRLNDMESEVCIPLITRQNMIGICNIGKKINGDMFSREDIALLETLGNQAAVAIENAQLYENLKKSEAQVRRSDRLASLGTLTAGLAHEIRNPLVAIKTFFQLLPDRLDDIEFRDHFLLITSGEVDRICSLVNELLEFARPSEPNYQENNINDIAEKIILLIDNQAKEKNIKIIKNYDLKIPLIMIDKEQVKQVLLNILLNAIDATPDKGTVTIGTGLITKANSKDYVQIIISDTGKGMSEGDIERIFTPFFTTKDKGSGLGLSISYKIVEEHMGSIDVESEIGKGSRFYVYLPVTPYRNNRTARKKMSFVDEIREEHEKNISYR